MRFFGQAMMYAFASGAVLAAPEGSPVAVAKPRGFFCVFFFWLVQNKGGQPQPREFTNATKILKYQELMCFLLLGVFNVFFSQIFSYNLLTFIPRSMLFFRILRCNQASLTLQPQWSKDTPTSSGFTFIGRSMEGRSWTEGWRLFPSPDQKA